MRLISVLFSFFLTIFNLNAQLPLQFNSSRLLPLDYTVDFELVEWSDSIEYQFLVVTVKQPNTVDSVQLSSIGRIPGNYYYSYLYQFYVNQDGCHFYPIKFRNESMKDTLNNLNYSVMKGFYLVNDFERNLDSLELVLVTHSGYSLQSQMYSSDDHVEIEYNPHGDIDTKNLRATKKWYKFWLQTNSQIDNPRLYHKGYSGCKD